MVNLYPPIVIPNGLVQLKKALTIDSAPTDMINFILDMCKWVLKNNIIQFGDTIWRQKKGTAMGTPVAVCFSIIYLAVLEIDTFDQCSRDSKFTEPTTIKRYIDDIASVFNDYHSALLFINTYNSIRPNSISVISNESVFVLDIEFYKGFRLHLGKLDSRVYQKPSNQYLYIPSMSYHNPVVFKSFIEADIKRYYLLISTQKELLTIK